MRGKTIKIEFRYSKRFECSYFERTVCMNAGYEATSAMAQLTPTTWGVIFDKYGGLRKMAQEVNWQISEWFAER